MNIFVGNLNWSTTEEELEQLFSAYGTVERVQIGVPGAMGQLWKASDNCSYRVTIVM